MSDCQAKRVFDRILSKAEAKKIPLWAHLDLTYKCNLNCLHCYCQNLSEDFSHHQNELSHEEIFDLLDQLAEAGSLYLTLSGGEVLLREDFFDIALYARKINFGLSVFTNGTLIDECIAQRLASLSLFSVEMSIYGVTEEVHDSITQKPGSFQKLCKAVKLLKDNKLKVVLKSVMMKPNFHQAGQIKRFAYQLGADEYRFAIEVSPKNDGCRFPQRLQLDEEKMSHILLSASDPSVTKHEYWDNPLAKPLCGTGSIGCYISPYGDIYPCIQLLVPMGNIRERSFKEIWYSPSDLRSQLDSLKTYQDLPLCRDCQYVRSCQKCIGLAYLETKDFQACYDTLSCVSRIEYELERSRYAEKKEKL